MLIPTWAVNPFEEYETGLTWSVAVDNNENIYVTTGNALWKLDAKQDTNQQAENLIEWSDTDYQFSGIVWKDDILYICGYLKNVIYQYDLISKSLSVFTGTSKSGWKDGHLHEAEFYHPWAIILDNNGDLLLTELNHIRKINMKTGIVETIAGCLSSEGGYLDGEANSARFNDPTGITIADDGTLYVADRTNCFIRKIKDGIVSTIGEDFHCTFEKAGKDSEDDSDSENDQVIERTFLRPFGLLWNPDNTLFVWESETTKLVDFKNRTISVVQEFKKMDIQAIKRDWRGNLFVEVADGVIKYEGTWKWERFLWIGNLKESYNDCHLAKLPRELIREITGHIRQGIHIQSSGM